MAQENIKVLAEKNLRVDGLILNNGQKKSFELFEGTPQGRRVRSNYLPLCKFDTTIEFQLDKKFSER